MNKKRQIHLKNTELRKSNISYTEKKPFEVAKSKNFAENRASLSKKKEEEKKELVDNVAEKEKETKKEEEKEKPNEEKPINDIVLLMDTKVTNIGQAFFSDEATRQSFTRIANVFDEIKEIIF